MAAPMQDCVILFGDSITSRQEVPNSFQALMGSSYRRTLDIINRGYGGYNTTFALPLVDQIFAKKADAAKSPVVRLVTIWLGTNDAALPEYPSHQHVPLSTYTSNLHSILTAITSPESPYAVAHTPGLNILLITPPAMYPPMMDDDFRSSRTLENTKRYVDAVISVGEEWKKKEEEKGNWRIATVDLWGAMLARTGGQNERLEKFFNDGLHLTTEGYAVLWEEYRKIVKTDFKNRGLDWEDLQDLPMRVPDWGELDYSDPESAVKKMKLPPIRQ